MPGYVRERGKRKDGSTIWQARWRPVDDPSDRLREERSFRTKREGERWIAARDSDVKVGTYAPAKRGEKLLSAVANELRDAEWGNLEPKTRAGYEAILKRWIVGEADPLRPGKPCRFRAAKVGAIDTATIQTFINEVRDARAPNTMRRIYGVLNAVLRLAVERGYISTNPCGSVKLPTKKRAGVRRSHLYLEGAELRGLAEAMPESWRLPVYIAGSCGLRAGELWALRRRDVDLLHSELTIHYALKEINSSAESMDDDKGLLVGPPKSAASRRRLSLASGLASMLRDVLDAPGDRGPRGYAVARAVDEDRADLEYTDDPNDPDRLLFTTPVLFDKKGEAYAGGAPIRHNLFYKRVFRPTITGDPDNEDSELRRDPALPKRLHGFRFHDLRHTAAALTLAESGGDLALVKERLGHENIATTVDLYGKRIASRDAKIADAVGASIFAPASDETKPLRALHA